MSIVVKKTAAVIALLLVAGRAIAQGADYAPPITVLRDDMRYSVARDGTYTMDETVSRRINTAQGVQMFGVNYVPFSAGLEDLVVLEAYTTGKDGKRVDVPREKIQNQPMPLGTTAPTFGDSKLKAIVFPGVEPGVTENYHLLRIVRKPLFAGQFSMIEYYSMDWDHQTSSITLVSPESLPLHVQAIGLKGGAVASDIHGTKKWVWTLSDVHAAAPESGMVAADDLGPRVTATSFPDFAAAADAYLAGSDPAAKVTPAIRAQAEQVTHGLTDPRAKAVAIYNWVSQNIRYVAITFGQGGVVPHAADAVLAARYGDCKDHAVLLEAMLSAVDIPSSPVLVNAANAFWRPDVAVLPGVFNHAITYVPQFHLFLDSTVAVAPFGTLPPNEAGKYALVARGDDGKPAIMQIPLTQAQRDNVRITTHASMAADGSVAGTTSYADTGSFEVIDRAVFSQVPAGQEAQMAAALLGRIGMPGSGTMALGDARDLTRPYTYSTSFSLPAYANLPGPGAFAIPSGVPALFGLSSFPAENALPARKYPFVCFAAHKVEDVELALPAGLSVKQLPAPSHLANALGSYEATYAQSGASVRVHRELTLTPKQAVCSPEEFQQVRALSTAVARDLRAQVIY